MRGSSHHMVPSTMITMSLKNPTSNPEVAEFCMKTGSEYMQQCHFFAGWLENRAAFGDLDTTQLFDELKGNICAVMREGYDTLGTQ